MDVFSKQEREVFYRVIEARREMRHFTPNSVISEDVLARLMQAAHQAPSVGLMQPWRFMHIIDLKVRKQIAALVDIEREQTAKALNERSRAFLKLKVEGIRECATLFVVALAPDDGTG